MISEKEVQAAWALIKAYENENGAIKTQPNAGVGNAEIPPFAKDFFNAVRTGTLHEHVYIFR